MADDKLKKRIQKRAEQILHDKIKPIVKQLIKDVNQEVKLAIERFYDDQFDTFYNSDFTPKTYVRQYGMQDMYRITTKRTPLGYIITYRFAADLETAQHTRWSGKADGANEAVFNLNFMYGYHGGYMLDKDNPKGWRYPRIRTIPSPYEQIKDYIDNYKIPEV